MFCQHSPFFWLSVSITLRSEPVWPKLALSNCETKALEANTLLWKTHCLPQRTQKEMFGLTLEETSSSWCSASSSTCLFLATSPLGQHKAAGQAMSRCKHSFLFPLILRPRPAKPAGKVAYGFSGRRIKSIWNKTIAVGFLLLTCTRVTLHAKWCSTLDDKDVQLVTWHVSDLRGIGTCDGDKPEAGKCHVAEWVLHSVRNLTDVCIPGLQAISHLSACSVKQLIPPAIPMCTQSQPKTSAPFRELCTGWLRPILWD